jgi:hypothetical protein
MRVSVVPLKRMLSENRSFDPKAIAILLEAYGGVVSELGLGPPEERESAAHLVLQVALDQTGLDATSLRDKAIALMGSEGANVRCLSPASLSSTG